MIKMIDPKDLTVFVTGATAGFGLALCRRFHEAGCKVIATGRRGDRLAALKAELGELCHVVELDVTDRKAVFKAFEMLPAPFDKPNICIANAGLGIARDLAQDSKIEHWEEMIATNINGAVSTVRAALVGMAERNDGHIVLLGSIAGDYPAPLSAIYGSTKAFIKQFALNLRADLIGSNLRVTNIEPGMAETEFSLVRMQGDKEKADAIYQGVAAMSAEDIAETIFWSCTLPRHLNINRLQIMPVMHAFSGIAIHRS